MAQLRTEVGIVHPITSPLSFWRWVKTFVVHPAIFSAYAKEEELVDTPPPVDPDHIFLGSMIKTYSLDGYVSSTTHLTKANGEELFLRNKDIEKTESGFSVFLAVSLFFGMGNRLNDELQPVRNLFGGWDSLWPESNEYKLTFSGKRLWNIIVSPIKLFVILPLKLVGFFFKLALNILKLVTEFLPELLVNYTAMWIGMISRELENSREKAKNPYERVLDSGDIHSYPWGKIIGLHFLGILTLIILFPLHYAARMVGFLGEAITAPEKSARDAWESGARVRPRALGYVLATLGAAFSLALTTTLWMIIFPFVVSGFLALFPKLVTVLASIAKWPVIASSLSFIQGTYTLVAGSLPAAFGTIVTALSTAFGLSVTNLVLAVSITTAVVAAPVLTIGSRIADELSNGWARWRADMGFAEGMKAIFVPKSSDVSDEIELTPTHTAHYVVVKSAQSTDAAQAQLDKMDKSQSEKIVHFKKTEKGYTEIVTEVPHYTRL